MSTRDELLYLARLYEQTERYSQMAIALTKVVDFEQQLNAEERNLFSVAFKNNINAIRTALRGVKSMLAKEQAKKSRNSPLLKEYKINLTKELFGECQNLINLLDTKVIKHTNSREGRVFYLKMKGDYYRYMSEVDVSESYRYPNQSAEAYKQAFDESMEGLPSTHPTRLGLTLNYSVYYYEICHDAAKACKMAKQAFDQAIADIESIDEDHYRDSTTIMQLLRDNLTLWTNEMEDEEAEDTN